MFAKFAMMGFLALGLTVGLGAAAQAGAPPHHYHHGHTHDGYGIPRGPHGPHGVHRSGYGPRPPVWHDTTHLDYHPGGFVPHRNHFHYVPGHYDVHRSGHWHW